MADVRNETYTEKTIWSRIYSEIASNFVIFNNYKVATHEILNQNDWNLIFLNNTHQ